MEVNNFKEIKEILTFNEGEDFYYVQLVQRPKDGNNVRGNNTNRMVKYYIIRSKDMLDRYMQEIIDLCKQFNARAYIHPTARKDSLVYAQYLKNVVDNYTSGNRMGKEFSSACGQHTFLSKNKKYVIDIDEFLDFKSTEQLIENLNNCRPIGNKILYTMSTKQGIHLITIPFDTNQFKNIYPNIDIHKNNPTLLYCFKGNKQ